MALEVEELKRINKELMARLSLVEASRGMSESSQLQPCHMEIVQRFIAGLMGRMVPTLPRIATSHVGVDTRDKQRSKTKWAVRRLYCDRQGALLARVSVIILFSTLEPVRTYSSDLAPRVFSQQPTSDPHTEWPRHTLGADRRHRKHKDTTGCSGFNHL
jgi:hypothetical protein